jgi:peptide/nickel transport system permease protein
MLKYIIKRVLIFIPTLLAISLLTFVISVNAPGDPVEQMLNRNGGDGQLTDKLATERVYREIRHTYGFDLPLFYFELTNATCPDTLYRISDLTQRITLERLSSQHGHWPDVSAYYLSLRAAEHTLSRMHGTTNNPALLLEMTRTIQSLYDEYEPQKIKRIFQQLQAMQKTGAGLEQAFPALAASAKTYSELLSRSNGWNKYIPAFHWYGLSNQYHRWFSHFVSGDFGISYQDKRPVSSVIRDAWPWTAGISLLSVVLAFLISIPVGVRSAIRKGSLAERSSTTFLFMLYSLPSFWVATLFVIFFCGGDWFNFFPGPGAPPLAADSTLWESIVQTAYRLVLPLICWTYGSLAFISRQMRGGILNEINQDYIRTARAKGLDEGAVIWKHALRNSLLPVITLFASVFPMVISGSIVLEHIFNIPGMGQLTYEALFAKNYPVIFAVLLITAFLTLFGNLVADILYALVDPRISYTKTKTV